MSIQRYYLSDFVSIQRQSFLKLLETGLIEEFAKRNPITNDNGELEILFYPEHYILTRPEYNPQEAILKNKSYTSKLFVPAQFTDKIRKIRILKWVYIGNIPLMTKRGHFILNGAARVIVNQILRSPGIYYQEKIYETYEEKWSPNPVESFKRYYADLICMRGTWLRIEMDKEKNIWAQMKKGPKIPMYWFLLAMGLSERTIIHKITDSFRLFGNLENPQKEVFRKISKENLQSTSKKEQNNKSNNIFGGISTSEEDSHRKVITPSKTVENIENSAEGEERKEKKKTYRYVKNTPEAWKEIYTLLSIKKRALPVSSGRGGKEEKLDYVEEGRKWLFNRFMNPRNYDLGKQGRYSFNKKLGLDISPNQLTLTALDVLYATDYLIKVEKGIYKIDDIDHLKNRRVRTAGDLIQIQIGVGLVRLEKSIREAFDKTSSSLTSYSDFSNSQGAVALSDKAQRGLQVRPPKGRALTTVKQLRSNLENKGEKFSRKNTKLQSNYAGYPVSSTKNFLNRENFQYRWKAYSFVNSKAFNSAIREFFGTSPLSQFMDQINPLSELTHKRRLSSMGPGGVTRDTATLAIRGIHPTHYGRICPIETPEGKNTGLVNSITTYARVNSNGIIESPFYRVYKGKVQKNAGMYYMNAEQEEKIHIISADVYKSSINFLPKGSIPARITGEFTRITRSEAQYIGVSPLQMISIATSLIPFLEHDDANRALMGSNMQRQAVPLIKPARPIVGTGLEARTVSDSGHVLISKFSGLVTYVSSKKIVVRSFIASSN